MLELKSLKKYFPVGRTLLRAVDDVSLTIGNDDILGVVGESGCGKSTLGRLALRLIEPTAGSVVFKGIELTRLPRRKLSLARQRMQMVFQNPFASFNPKLRLIASLIEVCRYYDMDTATAHTKIRRLIAEFGLSEDTLPRYPQELSGGQLQRFAIARALLSDPEILIADEPVSALDVSVQAQLLNLFALLRANRRCEGRNLSMLFISHDMSVIEYLCDRVAVMYLGKLVELAPSDVLFRDTAHPYTQALIAAAPRLGRSRAAAVALRGEVANPGAGNAVGCVFAPRCPHAVRQCRAEVPTLREIGARHAVACHAL
ncbi:MAG: ABC transporter ATP-binding protein [Treponema sp.]|jgi:oligopeptide/dipeptide ABC transporter ATP-binding protein|nr:ABC transporter ATP-binding protein [Treponema sp.]